MSAQARKLLERTSATHVTCGYADLNGNLRGQMMSRSRFESALRGGLGLVSEAVVLGVNDEILIPAGYLSFDLPFGDQLAQIAGSTGRLLPGFPTALSPFFFIDFPPGDTGHLWAPRQLHQRALARLGSLGFGAQIGCEYEFRLYGETEASARAKGFKNLEMAVPRSGYMNIARQAQDLPFISDLLDMCATLDIEVAGLHFEHGVGMLEVALQHEKADRAADNALLFKEFTKVLASERERLASFMAKPNLEEDGSSNHVHLSLTTANGRNAFFDAKAEHTMSQTLRYFIGGIQKLLPEFMLIFAPNANSWRRYVSDAFAPLSATWGVENRSVSVRVIPGDRRSQRLEFRAAGADTNPYLVQGVLIEMGCHGIDRKIEPLKPVTGSAFRQHDKLPKTTRFPPTLRDAIRMFRESKAAREIFGDDFVEMFAGTRQAQLDAMSDKRGRVSHLKEMQTFLAGI